VDRNDVQLLVGALAPPPGVLAAVESRSATQRTIQEILESMKLPTDPTELEAMINEAIVNQTMAAADLNALITALESAENQLVVPTGESMPTLVSLEPSQSSVQQETAMAAQQEVQTVPKVQGVQAMQENQGVREAAQGQEMGGGPTAGLSTQGLAQALRQPPEAGPSLQNGRISLGMLSCQPHGEAGVMLISLGLPQMVCL